MSQFCTIQSLELSSGSQSSHCSERHEEINVVFFYSSLAVSHGMEVRSRMNEAKTQLSNNTILAAYKLIGAAYAEMRY